MGKSEDTAASKALGKISLGREAESAPSRQAFFSQFLEALKTGGPGAQIPAIQNAVSAARVAQSGSMEATRQALATSGLDRTPFGARTLAETGRAGGLDISQIPANFVKQLMGQGTSAIFGGAESGVPGLSSAAGVQAGLRGQNSQAEAGAGAGIAAILAAALAAA